MIAPTRTKLVLTIYKIPVSIVIYPPYWGFSGLTWELKGRVVNSNSGKGIPRVGIRIKIDDEVFIAKTDNDGFFETKLRLPFTPLTGSYKIRLIASPVDPRLKEAEKEIELMTISPLTIAIPLTVSLALTKRAFKKRREEKTLSETVMIESREPVTVRRRKLSGVSAIYDSAVKIVEEYTDVKALHSYTVREYLSKVKPLLKDGLPYFRELTLMLERNVYGYIDVNIREAEKLLAKLEKALKVETLEGVN